MWDENSWIEQWQVEAEALFRHYEGLPPKLQADLDQLRQWGDEAHALADKIYHIRLQVYQQRLERQEREARIAAIVERQRRQTELELMQATLAKAQKRLARLKAYIDRVTDGVVLEMRRRYQAALAEQAQADAAQQAQTQADLALWEAFKISLHPQNMAPQIAPPAIDDLVRQQEREARLRREYAALQARPQVSEDENQAEWQAFIEQLDRPGKKKPRP
jgi:hypothetical protein